jgi:hypothetical protein
VSDLSIMDNGVGRCLSNIFLLIEEKLFQCLIFPTPLGSSGLDKSNG